MIRFTLNLCDVAVRRWTEDSYLQPVVVVLQVFDAESLSFNLLSQQRRVDHLDAGTGAGHHAGCWSHRAGERCEPKNVEPSFIISL